MRNNRIWRALREDYYDSLALHSCPSELLICIWRSIKLEVWKVTVAVAKFTDFGWLWFSYDRFFFFLFCRVAARRSRWPADKTSECRQSVSNSGSRFICGIFLSVVLWFLYINRKAFRIRKTYFQDFHFFYDEIFILLLWMGGDLEHRTVSVSRNHRNRRKIGVLTCSFVL
jgi:hypothetical protein